MTTSPTTLFVVSGASGSGKSAVCELLAERTGFPWHDFDADGIPNPIPRGWRHRTLESWVARAPDDGPCSGLCGPVAHGEVLSTPSARSLATVHTCLLDCADDVRVRRLLRRRMGVDLQTLRWAEWLRRHAADPTHDPFVLTDESDEEMQWDRWTTRPADDPSWSVPVIDTTALDVAAVADLVADWVNEHRE